MKIKMKVCDICKREIRPYYFERRIGTIVKCDGYKIIHKAKYFPDLPRKIDMCQDCYQDFIEFVEEKRKK